MYKCIAAVAVAIAAMIVQAEEGSAQRSGGVEIRRTTDGIPHVRANDWRGLGVGVGYAQAQDALCTLAEAFVTYRGQRSLFFGASARPRHNSTFGRVANIDLDFFFRAFADESVVARYREQQPPELNALIDGFAAGYNRHLADARSGRVPVANRACLQQPWVREIAPADLYRRLYAGQVAAGYLRFVAELTGAQPAAATTQGNTATLAERLAHPLGDQEGLGSNVLAFGGQATGGDGAVLFGNPHWYWSGPDRFYQMHLTIPGQLDVAGVALLGVPVIMVGFNDRVAWSHTVSEARRFGLFDLTLDPADPTRYVIDGRIEVMTAREIGVDVRGDDGAVHQVKRTFYRSRFGPLLNLGKHDAALGWNKTHAVAIRDINADNFRIFNNYLQWNRAQSLDQFIAIQRRELAMPWVNTVAIGQGDGRVWYGDIGAAPNAPDDLRARCTTRLATAFARIDPQTPFLDGSRADCDWRVDGAAAQAGALPAAQMPGLLRDDYVANMNDSYWLSNPRQPLEGFPALLGGEREALTLRGRLGHRMALSLVQQQFESAAALQRRVLHDVLVPRAYSAELFKGELLAQACTEAAIELDAATLAAAELDAAVPRSVDIGPACGILRKWPNRADADDRGALLWDVFWTRLRKEKSALVHEVPFAAATPLDTPRRPRVGDDRAARALAVAVLILQQRRVALDATLGSSRFVDSGGQRLPLYGGCPGAGYFVVMCNRSEKDPLQQLGVDAMANSYLQVVSFGADGVEAHTLLAHGQDEAAMTMQGAGDSAVARYARKDWLRFPFREDDIASDPALVRTVLQP